MGIYDVISFYTTAMLSTRTRQLRFMQNVRTEPEQAQVKDDGEWEVSSETRQAWAEAYRGEKAVTYETSYLPFLFPSLHDPAADAPSSLSPSDTLPPRGRRVFNKRGQQVTHQASRSATDTAPQQNIHPEDRPTKRTRPLSISSISVPLSRQSHPKDAKNTIFDMSRVGTDLRHSTMAATFLRPAGVDGPAETAKTFDPTKTASQPSTGATHPKVKRSRSSGEPDKAKKKAKLTLIE